MSLRLFENNLHRLIQNLNLQPITIFNLNIVMFSGLQWFCCNSMAKFSLNISLSLKCFIKVAPRLSTGLLPGNSFQWGQKRLFVNKSAVCNGHFCEWLVHSCLWNLFNLLDDIHALENLAKDDMVSIQPLCLHSCDEKL